MNARTKLMLIMAAAAFSGCATSNSPPQLPYPVFVQTEDMPTIFMAALPGVRAKQYVSDLRTRTTSNRVDIPADWKGSTGGAPEKALEVYVLSGEIRFSEFPLRAGGYAYVPPGSIGFRLESDTGAQILYFLDDVPDASVIRAPLILQSELLPWTEVSPGHYIKELRKDPGSGAKTWLQRVEPGVGLPWQSSSSLREGYLVQGSYQHSECFEGTAHTWQYSTGGYFLRPADIIHGGPNSRAISDSIWFLREPGEGIINNAAWCGGSAPAE
ncbi:MAG: DUF4437 domain-containing protein [Woeseiaceae bacterium]|nr:DUF4437 domain-containing protein [Woeseiaceae bacterium]